MPSSHACVGTGCKQFSFLLGLLPFLGMAASGGLALAAPGTESLALYVATNGDDRWTGRLPEPNGDRTDGPLASLAGAREAIRRARADAGNRTRPVSIRIRGGVYRMNAPLVLEPADSGTAQAPVVFEAFTGERPILSGGRTISGFQQNGPVWEAQLPQVKAGHWYFRQLFVGGQRRQLARSPNAGYFRIAGLLPGKSEPPANKAVARDKFKFASGDLKPWEQLRDVDLVLMHSWETSIHPLKKVDPATHIVELAAPLKEWWTIGYWEEKQRYYVENARELLDQPGEWYLNRQTGVLTYWPMPGETINQTEVVAPATTELLHLLGNADEGRFVEQVTFRGLAFHHSDWDLAPQGNSSTQAAVEVPSALTLDGARGCAIESCEVAHVGTYGVWLRRGCHECRIQRCRLFDLGAGGVRVGETQRAPADAAESNHNLVDNNHIYDGGRIYPAGVGIWVAQSSHNTISHNDVHDMLYTGISMGWNWDDSPNRTHHNTIEFNHVHHLVHGVLSDAGLIYCLGAAPGSVIRNNVFHDIWPYDTPPFGWGIYLDATCSGYRVENNLVYNTRSGGLMYNNGGHEHIIRNNVFAQSADFAMWPYWEKRPNTFEQNIVYLTQGELFVPFAQSSLRERLAANEPVGPWDRNLYWHTGGGDQLRFFRSNRDFAAWQKLGMDEHSIIADPLFVNAADHDFHLKPDSPALKLGFTPIDASKAGLYGDGAWVAEARSVRHPSTTLPKPPVPPAPTEVDDDFESTAVGAPPQAAHVDPENSGASIRISDEQSARGKHSMKFTDSKTLEPSWMPHLFYEPHMKNGRVRQSFDLRMDGDAKMFVEWRDETDYPRCVGPSISFDPGGRILVAGKLVATVPPRQWVHIELEATLGQNAPRTFVLTLTGPDGGKQAFTGLRFAGEDFHELHWLGFSSTAQADCSFYVDNMKVTCQTGG